MTGTEQVFVWVLGAALVATIFNAARKHYSAPAGRRR